MRQMSVVLFLQLKRAVFPISLQWLSGELAPTKAVELSKWKPLIERLKLMEDDSELRHFLLNRATPGEVLAIAAAFDLHEYELRNLEEESEKFRLLTGQLLGAPSAIYLCILGMTLCAVADGEISEDQA